MIRFRNILTLICVGMMAVVLFSYFNFDDLSWSANKSVYIVLITLSCVITSNILSNHADKKKEISS